MKKVDWRIMPISLVVGLMLFAFAGTQTIYATQWFDELGKLTWPDTKARLSGFADFLRTNPDSIGYIGYIGYHWRTEREQKELKSLMPKYLAYLKKTWKLRSKIVIIDAGQDQDFGYRIILQPVATGLDPPQFK